MHYKRVILVCAAALAAIFVLTGCGKNAVATVNGKQVPKDEFYTRLERMTIPVQGQNAQAGPVVLNQLIMDEVWTQIAKEKGVEPTTKQVESKIQWQKKGEDLAAKLRGQGLTVDEYKKMLLPRLAQYNVATKGIKVTEAEMKDFYNRHTSDMAFPIFKPRQVRLGLIITRTQQTADQAYLQLKDGKDFKDVARVMSAETSSSRGGEYGWVAKLPDDKLPLPPLWVNTAFKMPLNDFSKPMRVQSPKGPMWGIVRPMQFRPQMTLSYNDSKDFVHDYLATQKAMEQKVDVNKIFAAEFAKAKIKIKPDRYKAMQSNIERNQKLATKALKNAP